MDVPYLSTLGYWKAPLGLALALAVGSLLIFAFCRVRRREFGEPLHVALSLPLGLLCLYLFSYFRYMHSFGSGHAVVLVLSALAAILAFTSVERGNASQSRVTWKEGFGAVGIALCLLLALVALFATLSFMREGDAIYPAVYNLDLSFYANVGELIQRTGIESRQIEPFAAPIVSQPYHYPEIWLAVSFADLDGTLIYANSLLVVNPLLRVCILWIIYWWCRGEGLSWWWACLLALSALVLGGIKWDAFTTAPPAYYASWYSSYLLTPDGVSAKRLCAFIALVCVWLVYRLRSNRLAFAGLLLLPFVNFSLTIAAFGGLLGLVLYDLSTASPARASRVTLLLLLTAVAAGLAAVPLIQSGVGGAVHTSALRVSLDPLLLLSLPAKVILQAAASYVLFLPALIIWIVSAKRVELLVVGLSLVAAVVGWCLLYTSQDARQIYTSYASLVLIVLLISAARDLIKDAKRRWFVQAVRVSFVVGMLVCLVQASWFTSSFYLPATKLPELRLWAQIKAEGQSGMDVRAVYFADASVVGQRPITALYWIFNPLFQLSWRYNANVPTIGNPWALDSLTGSEVEEVRAKSPLYQLSLSQPAVPHDSLLLRFIRKERIDALMFHVPPDESLLRQLRIRRRYLTPGDRRTFVWLEQAY